MNEFADIIPPVHSDGKGTVVFRCLEKVWRTIGVSCSPYCRRFFFIDEWDRKDMSTAIFKDARDLLECVGRVKNVLHNILGYKKVEAIIREGQAFNILFCIL